MQAFNDLVRGCRSLPGLALGLTLCVACAKEAPSTRPTQPATQPATAGEAAEDSLQTLILEDVQPLRGGRILHVRGDGQAVYRIILRKPPQPDLVERRFAFTVKPETVTALNEAIRDGDFFGIALPERAGLPDEARPSITVILNSGRSRTLAKWRGIEHKGFDGLYQTCMAIVESGSQGRCEHDGRYEPNWSPPGFQMPSSDAFIRSE